MSLPLYMDHHVQGAITRGLRARGIDVLTAEEDGTKRWPDDQLLDRATSLARLLFSRDEDLLAEATLRQRMGRHFHGVAYARPNYVSIGQCIKDLEFPCTAGESDDVIDTVWHLPILK